MDAETARYIAALERRERRFARFLRARAFVGLLFMVLGAAGFVAALGVAAVAVGWWAEPSIEPWTRGFGAVLATGLPALFGAFAWTVGRRWWTQRRPDDLRHACACE